MMDLLTMALQMGCCIVVFVPLAFAGICTIFVAADWWEGRQR